MIKILIADDETFTREGIREMIDWEKLNITEIKEAYDGADALEIMENFEPNIILTDVRMPRLSGIDLAFKARELYPNCIILFMSGFSDKEYLKSAIKLKAINYVEKPIDIDELQENLNNAVIEFSKNNAIYNSIEKTLIDEISKYNDNDTIPSLINSYFPKSFNERLSNCSYVTVFIKTFTSIEKYKNNFVSEIKTILHSNNLDGLVSLNSDKKIIIQLFLPKNLSSLAKLPFFNDFLANLDEYLKSFTKYYIFVGQETNDINKLYQSYYSAVNLTAKSFYKDYNSVIFYENIKEASFEFNSSLYDEFENELKKQNKQELIKIVTNLTYSILTSTNSEVSFIKDIYYKLLLKLITFSKQHNLTIIHSTDDNIFNIISSFNNIYEIKNFLLDKINELFYSLEEKNHYSTPALKIIKYINDNYNSYDLSLDDISKNTFLTPAYICVIFKDYTGTTVNKYISEYRITKAKELLKDTNTKMSDIAQNVGYRDGNYFAKIFKKETGYSPSEYRRKFL